MLILIIILSIFLIGFVLLQPGKGDMLTGMGGLTGTFSSMFGSRQATNLLQKITIGLAGAIIVIAIITNLFFVGTTEAGPKAVTEGQSVPMSAPVQQPAPAPAPTGK